VSTKTKLSWLNQIFLEGIPKLSHKNFNKALDYYLTKKVVLANDQAAKKPTVSVFSWASSAMSTANVQAARIVSRLYKNDSVNSD